MTSQGTRLTAILAGWTALTRGEKPESLAAILDEAVVWHGLLPDLVCNGRGEVLGMFGRLAEHPPRITRIEGEEFGDRVVLSVEGPDFPENDVLAAGAPRSLVFTFAGGRVVRMDSLASRAEAFELAQS